MKLIMAIILGLVEGIAMRLLGIGMDRAKFASLPNFRANQRNPSRGRSEFESRLRSPVFRRPYEAYGTARKECLLLGMRAR